MALLNSYFLSKALLVSPCTYLVVMSVYVDSNVPYLAHIGRTIQDSWYLAQSCFFLLRYRPLSTVSKTIRFHYLHWRTKGVIFRNKENMIEFQRCIFRSPKAKYKGFPFYWSFLNEPRFRISLFSVFILKYKDFFFLD